MRFASSIAFIIFAAPLQSASDLLPPNLTIGRNLQTDAVVRLAAPAPPAGLLLTLTSEDPARPAALRPRDRARLRVALATHRGRRPR